MRYEPNNVLMLPMPTEKFKLVMNILIDRDLKEYDEEKEDERRKNAKNGKFIPFRACHLKYCEVDYDFYGLCSVLYAKAAEAINVTPDQIDLFIEVQEDNCATVIIVSSFLMNRHSISPQTHLRAFCLNSLTPSLISSVQWYVVVHHHQP